MAVPAERMDIVNVDIDPLAERSRRRRTLLRIGLPIGGVSLIAGFLLGIAVFADRANRVGVLGLSETLLLGLQERIALQISAYLEPAAHAALLAHSMLGRGGATENAAQAEVFATSVLHETQQIANVLFADGAGNFMLVRRAVGGPAGFIETKRILTGASGRSVEWVTRDEAGHVTAQREDPTDPYDARTRGWFTGARGIDDVYWSGVYIFFSERAPGVTTAVHGPGADPDVIGIDIKLDAISRFLGGLSIGRTGRAYIVSKTGEMIAGPDPARVLRERNGQLVPASVADTGDDDLAGTWDHYRVAGVGNRVIEVGGRRLISIVTPLTQSGTDWLLAIMVPEAEFSGFVFENTRRALLQSLIVVCLAGGLGVLLVRQGLRADRADRAVAERSAAVQKQSNAFARLATEVSLFGADGLPPPALTETLAEATGAKRVGLWRLVDQGRLLRCEDSYEPARSGHIAGLELSRQEVPALIEALLRCEEIDAADARRDRRTATLYGTLMASAGHQSLFAVPIAPVGDEVSGVLLLEDARRDAAARDLTRACATLVALRLLPAKTAASPAAADRGQPDGVAVGAAPEDEGDLDSALMPPEQIVNPAAILVLRLPDGNDSRVAHRIACAAQTIAAAHTIPYVKMLGGSIVAAAGHAGSDRTATARLADAAIALREACADMFDQSDDGAAFGLGLDAGTVQTGQLGSAPGLFNIWGEAVRGAETLAGSAPAGAIQVSEAVFALLNRGFLFRPRGRFHRPGIGETNLYVLAGRA